MYNEAIIKSNNIWSDKLELIKQVLSRANQHYAIEVMSLMICSTVAIYFFNFIRKFLKQKSVTKRTALNNQGTNKHKW